MKRFLALCLASCLWSLASGAKPPNIVFILADELGITDIKAFATRFSGVPADKLFHEGGIRVPTIVHWPGKYQGGRWCDQVIDATDFLPTLAEITGNRIPDHIDGRSAVPLLDDPAHRPAPRTFYWHYPFNVIVRHPHHGTPLSPHSAIRVGDHKLIWDWHGRIELYHIPEDPFEANNPATANPTLALKLHRQLKDWLGTNVAPVYHPQPNPDFDPSAPGTPFPFKDLR